MEQELTYLGIIFMSVVWTIATSLVGYTLYKVLTSKKAAEDESVNY